MTPAPIPVVVDHPAPMAVPARRGGRLGLFSVRARTMAAIPGVDPGALEPPRYAIPGVPYGVRKHAGGLWVTVEAIGPGGSGRYDATPAEVVAHLGSGSQTHRGCYDAGLLSLNAPPFMHRPDTPLRCAPAAERAGRLVPGAEAQVPEAVAAATRAMARTVATRLLHDGDRVWERLPIPLLYPSDPSRASCARLRGLHPPRLLADRIDHRGTLRGTDVSMPLLTDIRYKLDDLLYDVDCGMEDVDRFLEAAPSALVEVLRGIEGADRIETRLWPHVVAGARGGVEPGDREDAVEAVRAAALHLLERDPADLPGGHNPVYVRQVMQSYAVFVDAVARPSLHRQPAPGDEAALDGLAP